MSEAASRLPHGRGLGWKKDRFSRMDQVAHATKPIVARMSNTTDLLHLFDTTDQRVIGSCVGWSVAEHALAVMRILGYDRAFMPSPVVAYGLSRMRDEVDPLGADPGAFTRDQGTYIRNAMWVGANIGLVPMSNYRDTYRPRIDLPDDLTWEFKPDSVWRFRNKPLSASNLKDAGRRRFENYRKLPTLEDCLQCLDDGFPFILGITVRAGDYDAYGPKEEWGVYKTARENRILGGHAINGAFKDIPSRVIAAKNHWGPDAHKGKPHFRITFDRFLQDVSDCWTCKGISGIKPEGVKPAVQQIYDRIERLAA